MKVKDIMSKNPTCCTPQTRLKNVAQMMLECDCGEIPVLDNMTDLRPVGVITERDIVCRSIAQGKDPFEMTAKDCMTKPCVTVDEETIVEDCGRVLDDYGIRRAPVVDKKGSCCGIVSRADLAGSWKAGNVSEGL